MMKQISFALGEGGRDEGVGWRAVIELGRCYFFPLFAFLFSLFCEQWSGSKSLLAINLSSVVKILSRREAVAVHHDGVSKIYLHCIIVIVLLPELCA